MNDRPSADDLIYAQAAKLAGEIVGFSRMAARPDLACGEARDAAVMLVLLSLQDLIPLLPESLTIHTRKRRKDDADRR